jgi:cytochrome c-type biogenesis protein CcmH
MRRLIIGAALALAFTCSAFAADAPPLAQDPVVEARLVGIAEELRCLVCQNESLAGSRADLAEDLRREIRTLIRQGKTDQEVMDYLVARYGDFVRYRPPLKPSTWLLWIGPFVFLAGALAALIRHVRRPRETEPALSEADRVRAAALLAGEH